MSFFDLPLASDLFKSTKCPKTPCECHPEKKKDDAVEEDARLKNWEKWMQERKKTHRKLGRVLKRKPGLLLMNATEEVRKVKEEKLLLDYTKILTPPDPQRGSPAFWRMPVGLPDLCDKNIEPTIFAVQSYEEKCQIPILERVEVPKCILKEKDVLPRWRNSHLLWRGSKYRRQKCDALEKKLHYIEKHQPELDELCVIGQAFEGPQEEQPPGSPPQNFGKTSPKKTFDEKTQDLQQLHLVINEFEFTPFKELEPITYITVSFECDINYSEMECQKINFRNKGSSALRLYWSYFPKVSLFKDIISDDKGAVESYFFVDKNEKIVLPCDCLKIPVWFRVDKVGVFSERWEITTRPKIWDDTKRVVIVFQGSSFEGDLSARCNRITEKIDKKVCDRAVKETISDILENVEYEKPKYTLYRTDKAQYFEAINSEFDAFHKKPKYVYDESIVKELEDFYDEVKDEGDPEKWNFVIDDLKAVTKRRDIKNFEEIRTTDSEMPPILSQKLEDVISKLETPSMYVNHQKNKLHSAFLVLSSYIVKICDEIAILDGDFDFLSSASYPRRTVAHRKPMRLTHEFEDVVAYEGPKKLKLDKVTKKDQPPVEILKDIDWADAKKVYKTYYNLPDTPPSGKKGGKKSGKGGKGGKGKSEKSKDKGKDKASKKGAKVESPPKITIDDGYDHSVKENFDPFAGEYEENLLPTTSTINFEQSGSFTNVAFKKMEIDVKHREQYTYNLYLIFYTNLSKAVEGIVETVEMYKETKLKHTAVQAIKKSEALHESRMKLLKGKTGKADDSEEISRTCSSFDSLWSILKPHTHAPKYEVHKPISYPRETKIIKPPGDTPKTLVDVSTSTLEHGVLDVNWQDFKEVFMQKDYPPEEVPFDIETNIEIIDNKTSAQEMALFKTVSCQKNFEDHVSDVDLFYDSSTDEDANVCKCTSGSCEDI